MSSWSTNITVQIGEAETSFGAGLADHIAPADGVAVDESRLQIDAALAAAAQVIDSGALGPVGSTVMVTLSGYANPAHAPVEGRAGEVVSIALSQVGYAPPAADSEQSPGSVQTVQTRAVDDQAAAAQHTADEVARRAVEQAGPVAGPPGFDRDLQTALASADPAAIAALRATLGLAEPAAPAPVELGERRHAGGPRRIQQIAPSVERRIGAPRRASDAPAPVAVASWPGAELGQPDRRTGVLERRSHAGTGPDGSERRTGSGDRRGAQLPPLEHELGA